VLCAVLIAVTGVLVGRYFAASPAPPAPASTRSYESNTVVFASLQS